MADACYWWDANKHRWQDDVQGYGDEPGHVFLPRAFHQIAAWHLGDNWTGMEPEAFASSDDLAWSNFSLDDLRPEQNLLKERLLQRRDPSFVARIEGHPPSASSRAYYMVFTSQQSADARETLLSLQQQERRFEKVKGLVIEALRRGDLVAGLKPRDDQTEIAKCPPNLWRVNAADQRVRFYYCRLNPLGPPDVKRHTDSSDYYWIYITEDSLARFIGAKKAGRPAGLADPSEKYIVDDAIQRWNSGKYRKPIHALRAAIKSAEEAKKQIRAGIEQRLIKYMPRMKTKRK